MPNHVNSYVLFVCLLFNFRLFTVIDLSPGVLSAQQVVSEPGWLGFNLLNTVKMSSTKYDVKKFCGKGNFSLWQRWMKDLLIQQGVHKALLGKEKKPETMKDVE